MTRRWRALACDYDRTLTDERLRADPRALAALDEARAHGIAVIPVTGRPLAFVQKTLPHADSVVAENGAVRWYRDSIVREDWPDRARILDALDAAKVPLVTHEVMASAPRHLAATIERTLREAGLSASLSANMNSVMVLPRGVDKGTGLLAALAGLEVAPSECVAVGDGENDLAMFRVVGLSATPANAVREAREACDLALRGSFGSAIPELVQHLLADE